MPSAPPTPTATLLRPPSFHPATVEWTPGGPPRYVVINPMHIISLQDRTRTFAVRAVEKIKAISEKWFTHVLLLLFLLAYASLGALMFQWLEAPLERREKLSIIRTRDLVIENLWHVARVQNKSAEDWQKLAHQRMKEYEGQVEQHFKSKAASDSESTAWTFWGSLFYAGTIFTTIGYGSIVPATTAGQAATILYAFIGIPFLLMVLADLGRLFTRAIKAIFYYVKLFYHTGRFRKARRMGRRATAVPVQYMTVAWNKMPYAMYQNRIRKRGSMDVTNPDDLESGNNNDVSPTSQQGKRQVDDKSALSSKLKDNENGELSEENETKDQNTVNEGQPEIAETEIVATNMDDDVDDEFNLPVSLAVVLLIAYMMLGAFMFTLWEEWTFFESFYFVFVSMSTIGFGDYVPEHPIFMMGTFIYLLFGLALTSMCINVVQEKLSATFEMAKLRIGTTIGLDANMLMEEDIYGEKSETPDGQRKNKDSLKSRRGSKAVPSSTPTDDETDKELEIDEPKTHDQMTNGINEKSSKNFLEPPTMIQK